MKYFLFSLALFLLFFSSACDDETQFEEDLNLIREYLNTNNIDAETSSSGLFYRIIESGSSDRPGLNNTVEINYLGKLRDGTVFDQSPSGQTVEFPLRNLIRGWQLGIPLIGRGGRIELYIPSALGYGPSGVGQIPPNSVLIFDVELIDFR